MKSLLLLVFFIVTFSHASVIDGLMMLYKQNNPDSARMIGMYYEYGEENNSSMIDYEKALEWYDIAAKRFEDPIAANKLGRVNLQLYRKTKNSKYLKKASSYYKIGMKSDEELPKYVSMSSYALVQRLEGNIAEAVKYFRKAAKNGQSFAQFQLYQIFLERKNIGEANYWLHTTCTNKHIDKQITKYCKETSSAK